MNTLSTALIIGVVSVMLYYVAKVMTARSAEERHRYLDEEEAVATAAATVIPLV